ncbi:MAG: hypothetical protein JWQ43_588 [Glaciihabitans sp.]|nr:hypothetical protein [Glaciihabitans sp.]
MSNIEPTTPAAAPATAPAAAPAKKKGAARFITPALALVAVLGIGIFGGVLIGQNTASAETTQAGPGGSGGFGGGAEGGTGTAPDGAQAMGGFTSGTVVSVDGDTMVVENSDGEQVTVTTTDETTVTATEDTTLDTLAAGDTVTIVGEADDAGDVAATSVSEGATMGGFGGGGGSAPSN